MVCYFDCGQAWKGVVEFNQCALRSTTSCYFPATDIQRDRNATEK